MTEIKRYYGKHRGVVVANEDPMREGRLLVQVGDVGGVIPATWATPCFPATGIQMGVYMLRWRRCRHRPVAPISSFRPPARTP